MLLNKLAEVPKPRCTKSLINIFQKKAIKLRLPTRMAELVVKFMQLKFLTKNY